MNQPIQLSEIEIQEFIKTHKKVTGQTLEYEKAKRQATKLMKLMVLAVTTKLKSDKKKVTRKEHNLHDLELLKGF